MVEFKFPLLGSPPSAPCLMWAMKYNMAKIWLAKTKMNLKFKESKTCLTLSAAANRV